MTDPASAPRRPHIAWRHEPDSPLDDETLVRLHIDDLNRVINMSLTWWTAYKEVLEYLGRDGNGALALSVFRVTDDWPVERIMAASNHTGFRTASGGTLRQAGYELWSTDQWDAQGPVPRTEVHYDMVLEISDSLPEGIEGGRSARKAARARLAPLFERALEHFGPVTNL